MKYIDIEQKKSLHEKAISTLEGIGSMKKRLEIWAKYKKSIWVTRDEFEHKIEILNKCIARLEQRYAKIISQL